MDKEKKKKKEKPKQVRSKNWTKKKKRTRNIEPWKKKKEPCCTRIVLSKRLIIFELLFSLHISPYFGEIVF